MAFWGFQLVSRCSGCSAHIGNCVARSHTSDPPHLSRIGLYLIYFSHKFKSINTFTKCSMHVSLNWYFSCGNFLSSHSQPFLHSPYFHVYTYIHIRTYINIHTIHSLQTNNKLGDLINVHIISGTAAPAVLTSNDDGDWRRTASETVQEAAPERPGKRI